MVKKIPITVMGYRCERCGHKWFPRNDDLPIVCPTCKSPYWHKPRKTGVRHYKDENGA